MKGYRLKITMKSSKLPIWRCVVVSEQLTSYQLRQAIQGAFGQCDYHLHKFKSKKLGLPIREMWEEGGLVESCGCDVLGEGTRIGTLVAENLRSIYTHDFRDVWGRQIPMEKEVEYECNYPQISKYKGNNIPEDCGDVDDYYDLLDRPDDPEAEDRDLMEEQACQQEVREYGLDEVSTNLEAHPASGQGRTENGQRDTAREPTVQEHTADKQKTGTQDAEKSGTQKLNLRVICTLEKLFSGFDKTELLRITKVHHIGGYDELGKNKLTPVLAVALLDSQRMGWFSGILNGETTAEFEKTAATGGIEHQGDLEILSSLYYGGYCGFTDPGTVVVPVDVAKAYNEVNTERLQSNRHCRSRVWACCRATVYLHGATDVGQVETICKTAGCEVDAEKVTHLCREMKGVWTDFAYWDDRFIDWDLIQADAYKDVLNYQKNKESYIPSTPQVKEIIRTGVVELKKYIRLLKASFLAMVGRDEETTREAASSIHHHVRLRTTPKAVEDIMEHLRLNPDPQERMNGFDKVTEQV